MTTFYLSNAGDDSGTGTSPAAPWATIGRLNTALNAQQVIGGDSVLFRRGDVFFGGPGGDGHYPYPNSSPVTFGAYGDGAKPRISCYKIAFQGGWAEVTTGVWRIDLAAGSGAYGGATTRPSTEVGHLRVDGAVFGKKKNALNQLAEQWDFYSGDYARTDVNNFVWVRSDGNPSAGGRRIEIAVDGAVFELTRNNTIIRDLDLYGADFGVLASSYWVPRNIQILDCDVHDIGGAYVHAGGDFQYGSPTRAGNGIEAWIGCRDWVIEGCRIWNAYDVAVTFQGRQGVQRPENRGYYDLHARRNTIWNCSQSFEIGSYGTDGEGMVNCSFTDNRCFDAGTGWGWRDRNDPAGRGCHILTYDYNLPYDITIERNIFFGAKTNYIYAHTGLPADWTLRDNVVYLEPGTPIQWSLLPEWRRPETIEQAAAYVAATGREQGTTWLSSRATAEAYLDSLSVAAKLIPTATGMRVLRGSTTPWPVTPAVPADPAGVA